MVPFSVALTDLQMYDVLAHCGQVNSARLRMFRRGFGKMLPAQTEVMLCV